MSSTRRTDAERLAVLENEVQNIKAVVSRSELKIDDLAVKIDDNFARKNDLKEVQVDLEAIKNSRTTEKWLTRLLLTASVILNVIAVYELFNR